LKPCIIFDIDGTLANCEHRRHFVSGSKKDWKSFLAGCTKDPAIPQVLWLNELIQTTKRDHSMPIFLCSGRSEDERKDTEWWLDQKKVNFDQMFMRAAGDYRQDSIVKRELLDQIRAFGYEPWLIFDDRQCVTDMWRKEGLFVLQCDPNPSATLHEGYEFHPSVKYPLDILIGPSGSGKSTYARDNYYGDIVISSDRLRENFCGDFKDQSQNERVFEAMHTLAKEKLRLGIPVVLDATHIKRADRIKAAKIVPDSVPVRYIVIDRPLGDKILDSGWRAAVSVKGRPLVSYHDQVFKSNIKDIMKGDDLKNVTVVDLRKY
jgi:hypothetical protein